MDRVGIVGYGNLGHAVERRLVEKGSNIVAIFSKRNYVVSPFSYTHNIPPIKIILNKKTPC